MHSSFPTTSLLILTVAYNLLHLSTLTNAFLPLASSPFTVQSSQIPQAGRISTLYANPQGTADTDNKKQRRSKSTAPKTANFEYQELKIQMQAMKDEKVTSSKLDLPKRIELEGYVKRILNQRPSPIPLYDLAQHLPGTQWRLAFSTEGLLSESLPKDATICLKFAEDEGSNNQVEYSLEFPKTLALKRLVAKSTYTVSSSPADAGLVRIEYDSISTDVFGFTNVGVGLFGMLKGRSTFIPSVYFDGEVWIERGVDPAGTEFFNVYAAVEEDK